MMWRLQEALNERDEHTRSLVLTTWLAFASVPRFDRLVCQNWLFNFDTHPHRTHDSLRLKK